MKNNKKILWTLIVILAIIFTSLVFWKMKGTNKSANGNTAEQTEKTVITGSDISVDYIGSFESGEVFDTSLKDIAQKNGLYNEKRTYQPLEFVVGQHQMIPGFEKGVLGMKVGETKKITLSPDEAYGESNPSLITGIDLKIFKDAGIDPKVGEEYPFGGGQNVMNGKILEISGDVVKMDFNSPMAGKTLIFDITVKSIK